MSERYHPSFPDKLAERIEEYEEDRGIDPNELIRSSVDEKLSEEGY